MRCRILLIPLLGTALGCGDSLAPNAEPVLLLEGDTSFALVNTTSGYEIGYAALTTRQAPLVLLAACRNWPRIAPRGNAIVRHTEVLGYQGPGTDSATVHWCRLEGDTELEAGTLETPL